MFKDRLEFEREALEHINVLYRSALRMTGNPSEAEDIIQDVYLRAIRFYQQFQRGTNMRAWLFKILRNTFINRYRQNSRIPYQIAVDEPEFTPAEFEVATKRASRTGPEEEFLRRLTAEEIQKALNKLPEKFQRIIVLSDVEGFSYKEIAEIEDCPLGTVMSRLYRARRILQELLKDVKNF